MNDSEEKLRLLDAQNLKKYRSSELLNEAADIILRKELGPPIRDKMWSILDAPIGSYYGPRSLHKFPAVKYKKGLTKNKSYHLAYCVSIFC